MYDAICNLVTLRNSEYPLLLPQSAGKLKDGTQEGMLVPHGFSNHPPDSLAGYIIASRIPRQFGFHPPSTCIGVEETSTPLTAEDQQAVLVLAEIAMARNILRPAFGGFGSISSAHSLSFRGLHGYIQSQNKLGEITQGKLDSFHEKDPWVGVPPYMETLQRSAELLASLSNIGPTIYQISLGVVGAFYILSLGALKLLQAK